MVVRGRGDVVKTCKFRYILTQRSNLIGIETATIIERTS